MCLLQKSYRFGSHSGIGSLARAVNAGARAEVKATLRQPFDDIALHPLSTTEEYEAMLGAAQQGYERYLQLRRERAEPQAMLAAFSEFQLLCALREGPYGVSGVNERLEQRLNRQRAIALPRHSRWYDGRPIMISRNDSALGLFNGDIGIALERNGELRVWFLMPDGAIKSVQPSRLPEHDTAWAMTVHKSQGSEFEHAALILLDAQRPAGDPRTGLHGDHPRETAVVALCRRAGALPGHCDVHRTAQRPGGDFRRARSPLRRRVRAMENAAAVARAGGKISN